MDLFFTVYDRDYAHYVSIILGIFYLLAECLNKWISQGYPSLQDLTLVAKNLVLFHLVIGKIAGEQW